MAIGLKAAIALLVTLTVAGHILCAGMAGSGPPVVGHGPMTGGRGADGCVVSDAFAGPVKQQASLASEWTVALDVEVRIECRAVDGTYFRLRLAGAVDLDLLSSRKR